MFLCSPSNLELLSNPKDHLALNPTIKMPSLCCVLSVQTAVICLQIPALDIFFINKAAVACLTSFFKKGDN